MRIRAHTTRAARRKLCQLWNEPSLRFQWDAPNWPKGYGALVRASDDALNAADPRSRTVLAGLPNRSWQELSRLYKAGGIKGHFDIAAFHPYTDRPEFVVRIARYIRNDSEDLLEF